MDWELLTYIIFFSITCATQFIIIYYKICNMIKMVCLQFIIWYYVYVKSIIDQYSSTISNINVSTVVKKKKYDI